MVAPTGRQGERLFVVMSNAKPSVLLIEDDVDTGAAMMKFLTLSGYAPLLCPDGQSALSAISAATPDAVITDIHLPDINGLLLSQKLRDALGPKTPIIVLSGDTSTEVIKSLSHAGATYFFNKPVNLQVLKQHLAEYLPVGV